MLGADALGMGGQLVDLVANEQLSRTFDEEEVFSDTDRFEIVGDLGGGAYGTVYKARDRSKQGQIVALKKMYIKEDPDIGIPPFVMREVANLKRLSEPPDGREPYIVRYGGREGGLCMHTCMRSEPIGRAGREGRGTNWLLQPCASCGSHTVWWCCGLQSIYLCRSVFTFRLYMQMFGGVWYIQYVHA